MFLVLLALLRVEVARGTTDSNYTVVSWGSQGDIPSSSVQLELSGNIQDVIASPHAFAVIKSSGSVSRDVTTFGHKRSGGDSSHVQKYLKDISTILYTEHAFAAKNRTGNVITWGDATTGGDYSSVIKGYDNDTVFDAIDSTSYQFAAYSSGELLTWGLSPLHEKTEPLPLNKSKPDERIRKNGIFGNHGAFVAILQGDDGCAIAWGAKAWGGNPDTTKSPVTSKPGQLCYNFKTFYANEVAFTGIPEGTGEVMWWGGAPDPTEVRQIPELYNPQFVGTTSRAFAAITQAGDVKAWGDESVGGKIDSLIAGALNDKRIENLYSTSGAFAARSTDGEVFTWGSPKLGGDSSSLRSFLSQGVEAVYSNMNAFVAVKHHNETKLPIVVAWGHPDRGGTLRNPQWEGHVVKIVSTARAFAALVQISAHTFKVHTWGDPSYGGDSSFVDQTLHGRVKDVFANRRGKAFAAKVCIPGCKTATQCNIQTCTPCAHDEYFDRATVTCMQCPENQVPTTAKDGCQFCPYGQYRNYTSIDSTGIQQCRDCQPDEFSNPENQSGFCLKCDAAKGEVPSDDKSKCRSCEQFEVSTLQGSCQTCEIGTIPDENRRYNCKPCEQGHYATTGSKDTKAECKPCASYEYTNSNGDGCQLRQMILTPVICFFFLLVVLCVYKSRYTVGRYFAMSRMRNVLLNSRYDIEELHKAKQQAHLAGIKRGNQNLAAIQKTFILQTARSNVSAHTVKTMRTGRTATRSATVSTFAHPSTVRTRVSKRRMTRASNFSAYTSTTHATSRAKTATRATMATTTQSDDDSSFRPVIMVRPLTDLGMTVDPRTGLVTAVDKLGQVYDKGVRVGWRIVRVHDEEYSSEVLRDYQYESGSEDFQLTFVLKSCIFRKVAKEFTLDDLPVDWVFATVLRTKDNILAATSVLSSTDVAEVHEAFTPSYKLLQKSGAWEVIPRADDQRDSTCKLICKEVETSTRRRIYKAFKAKFLSVTGCDRSTRLARMQHFMQYLSDWTVDKLEYLEWQIRFKLSGAQSDEFMDIRLSQLNGSELMTVLERQYISQKCKYTQLDALFDTVGEGDLSLIRGKWFESDTDHKYAHPRFKRKQDLPEEAFWTKEALQFQERFIAVVAVSYCWCHAIHCDPKGKHFKIIKQAVELRLKARGRALKQDIALFFDYMSITQDEENCGPGGALVMDPQRGKKRTPEEHASFRRGLMAVNIPYGNQLVESWILNWVPDGISYSYDQRAWPCFEKAVSSLIKDVSNLIVLTDRVLTITDPDDLLKTAKSTRSAPCTPPRFDDVIERKKVTSGRDIKMLKQKYRETFSEVIAQAKSLWFTDLNWSDFEAHQLEELFKYLSGQKRLFLETVILQRNKFSALAALNLIKAAGQCRSVSTLDLSDNFIKDDKDVHDKLILAWQNCGKLSAGLRLDTKRKEMKKDFALRHRLNADQDTIPDAVEEKTFPSIASEHVELAIADDSDSDDIPDRPMPALIGIKDSQDPEAHDREATETAHLLSSGSRSVTRRLHDADDDASSDDE